MAEWESDDTGEEEDTGEEQTSEGEDVDFTVSMSLWDACYL